MRQRLDMDKIAQAFGAARKGKVAVTGGHFGAVQLLAEVKARFAALSRAGRAMEPTWTGRCLVPVASSTLTRLEELAAKIRERCQVPIEPMQIAGLLLEKTPERMSAEEAEGLLLSSKRKEQK